VGREEQEEEEANQKQGKGVYIWLDYIRWQTRTLKLGSF